MHHLSRVMKSCKFIFVVREATAADLAQLAEQLICNQPVVGSNPTVGSRLGGSGSPAVFSQDLVVDIR